MGKTGRSHTASTVVFMDRFADIPRSLPEARAKLRGGLGECASSICAAPCRVILRLFDLASSAFARLTAERKRVAKSMAVRAGDCLLGVLLTKFFELLLGF